MTYGQYILPGELALIFGFVLLPAWIAAIAAQILYLNKKRAFVFGRSRAVLGLGATVLIGTLGSVAAFVAAPSSWGSAFGIREVSLLGQQWPVWPLSFAIVGAAAVPSTWWVLRGSRRAA